MYVIIELIFGLMLLLFVLTNVVSNAHKQNEVTTFMKYAIPVSWFSSFDETFLRAWPKRAFSNVIFKAKTQLLGQQTISYSRSTVLLTQERLGRWYV